MQDLRNLIAFLSVQAREDVSERGQKHLLNALVKGSDTISECCQLGRMHAPRWLPPPHTHTHSQIQSNAYHVRNWCTRPMWQSRQETVEAAGTENQIGSGLSLRSNQPLGSVGYSYRGQKGLSPLLQKPLCMIPHLVFVRLWRTYCPMTSVRVDIELSADFIWINF